MHGEKDEINSIQVDEISMQVFTELNVTNHCCLYRIKIMRHSEASNYNTEEWIKENTPSKLNV